MHWLIDGLQRCSNIEDFINDRFAISKMYKGIILTTKQIKR